MAPCRHLFFISFLSLLSAISLPIGSAEQYHITTEYQLDQLLCQHSLPLSSNDSTLILYTNVTHEIISKGHCTVNINQSIAIVSNDPVKQATIFCIAPSGFIFTGDNSNLIVERVIFENCGANISLLDQAILDSINSTDSPVYFTSHQRAVLILYKLESALFENVNITAYNGFAIVAVNLRNGSFFSLTIASSQNSQLQKGISTGSGFLAVFRNRSNSSELNSTSPYQISLSSTTFLLNQDFINEYNCIGNIYNSSISELERSPIVNAAGLTVVNAQNDIPAIVKVIDSYFSHCYGSLAGAVLIIHQNSWIQSQTIITTTDLGRNNNFKPCYGGAIVAVVFFDQETSKILNSFVNQKIHRPLFVSNCDIHDSGRDGPKFMGAINLLMVNSPALYSILFHLHQVTMAFNRATDGGSCVMATTDPPMREGHNSGMEIVLESMITCNNSISQHGNDLINAYPTSMFLIYDAKNVTVNGTKEKPGVFSYNYGSVFKLVRSNVVFQGFLSFHNNTGNRGGAVMLLGSNYIYLTPGLRADFIGNKAETLGGAIYATNGESYTTSGCTFQVSDYHNISIQLTNNAAGVAGNAIYSTNLYNCYMGDFPNAMDDGDLSAIYESIFVNPLNQTLSTNPVTITPCSGAPSSYYGYAGGTLQILLEAKDAIGQPTHGVVTVSAAMATYDGPKPIDWWFSERESMQVINESCTSVNVTIHTRDFSTVDMKSEQVAFLLFSLSNADSTIRVDVSLFSCPIGFKLDANKTGVCICSDVVEKLSILHNSHIQCDISTKSFTRPTPSTWVGLIHVNDTAHLSTSTHCPPVYCSAGSSLDSLVANTSGTYLVQSSNSTMMKPICQHHRNGTLCGQCDEGYSVVFGSDQCNNCTNVYLLTLMGYVAAGPFLLLLLYSLKLTLVTGTINGILFYAQAANVGILDALSRSGVMSKTLRIFLSVLNLGLGFPLCFFNGMTELWKAGLNLIFPVYLLLIVVLLIVACRYSVRLSNRIARNSIQVLTTVVHLSFSRLLSALIVAFAPVTIFTANSSYVVWYWDASIAYTSLEHVLLIVATLTVVLSLLLPYLLLLLLPRLPGICGGKVMEFTRPILESIYAPYKEGRQYWFTVRLVLLVFIYVLYSVEPYEPVVFVTFALVLAFSVIVQAIFNPYKSKAVNVLDCWLLVNLAFLFGVIYSQKQEDATVYCIVGTSLVLVTFLCVIIYHALMVSGKLDKLNDKLNWIWVVVVKRHVFNKTRNTAGLINGIKANDRQDDPFYADCDEYREPLISPTSTTLRCSKH